MASKLDLTFKRGDDLYARDLQAMVDAINKIDGSGDVGLRFKGYLLKVSDLSSITSPRVGDIYHVLFDTDSDNNYILGSNGKAIRIDSWWMYVKDLSTGESETETGWVCISNRDRGLTQKEINEIIEN